MDGPEVRDPRAALTSSPFASLPADIQEELTRDARLVGLAAGETRHREGDRRPHLDVVVTGFARAFVSAPDGRTLTVRYCRPGAILGAVSLYSDPFIMPATVRCLVETRFLALSPRWVRHLAERDPRVARILLVELSERVASFIAEIPRGAFTTVRQRVARHLLDLASEDQQDADLIARVSQSELAASVGSAREVVVRVLRGLRQEGVITTGRGGITVLDPVRLDAARSAATPPR